MPLSDREFPAHNGGMDHARVQLSLASMLLLVALCAVNFWLFRLGIIWGLLGLSVTKHLVIAFLCHAVGLNRKNEARAVAESRPLPEPSSN